MSNSLEIFLTPGHYLVKLFLSGYLHLVGPELSTILSAFISWLIWAAVIRMVWAITLKLFGFGKRTPY